MRWRGSGAGRLAPAALPALVRRAAATPCPSISRILRPGCSPAWAERRPRPHPTPDPTAADARPPTRNLHDRYAPHPAVGGVHDVARPALGRLEQAHRPAVDLRRLAAGRRPAPAPTRPARVAPRPACPRRLPCPRQPVPQPAPWPPCPRRAPATPAGELVTVTTDVVKATFSSQGGTLVQLELLGYRDHADRQPQRGAARPERQAAVRGADRPDHQPGRRGAAQPPDADDRGAGRAHAGSRRAGADGALRVGRRRRRASWPRPTPSSAASTPSASSTSSATHGRRAVTPQLYLQLARDGNPPEGESQLLLHLHRPGGLHRCQQVPEDRLQGHRQGQRQPRQAAADDGWVAMVQHYFASAWLVPQAGPREFRTAKVADNHYTVAMVLPLGDVAPGATQGARGDAVCRPAGREQARRTGPGPRTGEGLRLVHRAGQAAVLAADASCTASSATGAGPSWRWWCC